MSKPQNYEGIIFEHFKVIKKLKFYGDKHPYYLCKCNCGNDFIVRCDNIHKKSSCGCLTSLLKSQAVSIHGMSRSKLYRIWNAMKERCNNPKDKGYKNYGQRGISVFPSWNDDFMEFYKWSMENGYDENKKGMDCSIDRIDPNGNYEPNNCRWVGISVQSNNKTNTVWLEFNGERHSLTEWAGILGINRSTLRRRYILNWSVEKMLTQPVDKNRSHRRKGG